MADRRKAIARAEYSFGRQIKSQHELHTLHWSSENISWENINVPPKVVLATGMMRSYGDSCLNNNGVVISTLGMNHVLGFDMKAGTLRVEAGCTFDQLLKLIVPNGFFLPVVPGTKFITVGGAIANDIHGKNHHSAGTFGSHILKLELLRSDNQRLICSPLENPSLFSATIGGLGLTGIILWAEIKLLPIKSAFLQCEYIPMHNFADFFKLEEESAKDFTYTVAWVDSTAKQTGRGIFMRANHITGALQDALQVHKEPRWSIPTNLPLSFVNRISTKIFNELFYFKNGKHPKKFIQHYDPYFFPLDKVNHWNQFFGPNGFLQYQCVVPEEAAASIDQILKLTRAETPGSAVTVLKKFGSISSPGILSFPMPGWTLTLDFPAGNLRTELALKKMDDIVQNVGGRLYPAKDARMSRTMFMKGYPNAHKFTPNIDPVFSSNFWRRMMQQK